jgi:hypothetical protein
VADQRQDTHGVAGPAGVEDLRQILDTSALRGAELARLHLLEQSLNQLLTSELEGDLSCREKALDALCRIRRKAGRAFEPEGCRQRCATALRAL